MTKTQAQVYLGALAVAVLFGVYALTTVVPLQSTPAAAVAATESRTVRWLLSHEPADVYAQAINVFAEALSNESNGALTLEIVTPGQLGIEGQASNEQILQALSSGAVELSSTYGVANGTLDSRFWAWQMPFLFNSYEEVEAAFDTDEAEALLADFSAATPVHALAYTLSGGFRLVASSHPIGSIADVRGLRIATAGGPVAEALWREVGAIPVTAGSPEAVDVDAVETTYARLTAAVGSNSELAQYIAETNHSLFLTTLVAGDAFYDSLTLEEQQALVRAARTAAAVERADAIVLNESTKSALEAEGSVVTSFSDGEREVFEQMAASVYDTFMPLFNTRVFSAD